MEITKPGAYKIPCEIYHADPCPVPSLSRSVMKDLLYRSPAHAFFNHPRLNPDHKDEEREIFDIGTAAHSLLLEGIDCMEIIDAPDWRAKAAREARDEARKVGKTPILQKNYDAVFEMVVAAKFFLTESIVKGLSGGDPELSYFWKEKETWLRTRLDWISKDRALILDYKTTGQSANPEDYVKTVISNGLDIQKALYCRGVKAIDGTNPEMVFLLQETYEPYLCSLITLDMIFEEIGKEKVTRAIAMWRECMSTGKWPGYSNHLYTLEAPGWSIAQWEERRSRLMEKKEEAA